MRRHPPWLFLLLLAGCARPDTAPPQVGLVAPLGGGVAPGRAVAAEGYAFDPSGVAQVWVNGQAVLPPEETGERLVRFRFRLQAPSSGRVELLLEAEDLRGNRAQKRIPLVLDASPPRILLERVEREGGVYRVYGRVEDNVGVDRVVARVGERYVPLSLPKGAEVVFSVEVPPGAALIAVDAAGNRASRTVP
ncbi:hypothetical protein GCM10007092_00410 [Thermus composti]|uniref:Lipoprotein n=1 Tax=Thermus composti TaxID=532059 RepID=A0ABV6PZQ2_9DEIN|nr:hypothetical protein [Thermus composti]GGM91364.1 hypothetical protein GCM10007092_00410 [Thermus composti]